jgi:hypothetical protein
MPLLHFLMTKTSGFMHFLLAICVVYKCMKTTWKKPLITALPIENETAFFDPESVE